MLHRVKFLSMKKGFLIPRFRDYSQGTVILCRVILYNFRVLKLHNNRPQTLTLVQFNNSRGQKNKKNLSLCTIKCFSTPGLKIKMSKDGILENVLILKLPSRRVHKCHRVLRLWEEFCSAFGSPIRSDPTLLRFSHFWVLEDKYKMNLTDSLID